MLQRWVVAALLAVPATTAAQNEDVRAEVGADGVQRIEIVGSSYHFEPAHVVVQVGIPVELTLRRERGLASHDFQLAAPEAGIDVHVELEREPQVLMFTPRVTGQFEFLCTKDPPLFRSHYEHGMHGVLEVID